MFTGAEVTLNDSKVICSESKSPHAKKNACCMSNAKKKKKKLNNKLLPTTPFDGDKGRVLSSLRWWYDMKENIQNQFTSAFFLDAKVIITAK